MEVERVEVSERLDWVGVLEFGFYDRGVEVVGRLVVWNVMKLEEDGKCEFFLLFCFFGVFGLFEVWSIYMIC